MARYEIGVSFPIMIHARDGYGNCPKLVKWELLDPAWALKVHGQTLERLAERGGLCPEEIFINIHHLKFMDEVDKKEAVALIKSISYD